MSEPNLKLATAYHRAAFDWLEMARRTKDTTLRPRMLAIAHEWLKMAHEATTNVPPAEETPRFH
jgi:hypothetical protein